MKKITKLKSEKIFEIAKKEIELIPEGYYRKRLHAKAYIIEREVSKTTNAKEIPFNKTINVLMYETENLGTRKWNDYVRVYEIKEVKFARETNNFYVTEKGNKINKQRVIAWF